MPVCSLVQPDGKSKALTWQGLEVSFPLELSEMRTKNVCSNGALDKSIHQRAYVMSTCRIHTKLQVAWQPY